MRRRLSVLLKTSPVEEQPSRHLPKGDVILRTSDGTELEVDKCILANVSSTFADMFSLPCACASPGASVGEEKQTIDVAEPKEVWVELLAFCYHRTDELCLPLDTVRVLLTAADKYHMRAVTQWVRRTLLRPEYVSRQTLRVYALACAFGLDDVARVAARRCLDLPADLGQAKELELISALQYTRLLEYRKQCAAAAVQAVVVKPVPVWMIDVKKLLGPCEKCLNDFFCTNNLVAIKSTTRTKTVMKIRAAWFDYFDKLAKALKICPLPYVARDSMLLGLVVGSVDGCAQCKLHALDQAMNFADVVRARIDAAITKVQLEL
ncbi:hypothetical protein C2E23DRAFT_889490 [Lenzites betulinus]|nr:hypothetical protein C2E23DRAFT_889490 [Lenzites betulinus]